MESCEMHNTITGALGHVPATNIPTEDRFARVSQQAGSCHGHVPSLSTMRSRHMLGEAQAWHHVAMSKSVSQQDSRVEPLAKKPKNSWIVFLSSPPDVGNCPLKSELWRRMTPEQKLPYQERFRELATQGQW